MKNNLKSFAKLKDITKSTIEKKNQEEDEYKKYDAIINKLAQALINKDKQVYQIENDFSTSKRNPSVATRSNLKMTVSRTKDERNDKDFLINFMNSDNISTQISPNNLHLLSDEDRNKSISSTEKYKNLSDLMIDDRNSYSECHFIQNSEDRMILNLYSILGRKSKELFLEEDKKDKIEKTRILFNKINNIKIPKFEFKQNDKSKDINNIDLGQSFKIIDEDISSDLKSNISEEKKEEKPEFFSYEEKNKNNNKDECYFKKKEKGAFLIPDLVEIPDYQKRRRIIKQKYRENYENFWDPEIDANTLSNINHNMIKIEDIYNKKQKNEKNEENNENSDDEKEINAEEILTSESENEEQNKGDLKDGEEVPKIGKIRFIEFYDVSPVQMGLSITVDNNKIKEKLYNMELKERNELILEKISEFDEKAFPKYGTKLSTDLIFKIALRNDNNEIMETERFSINDFDRYLDKFKNNILNKEKKQKIIIERKSNSVKLKGKLSEEPLTIRKTNKNVFRTISDYTNKLNNEQIFKLNENDKKFEKEEKMKNDSSIKFENQEDGENENIIKDLINNNSLFSNKTSIKDKNTSQEMSKKKSKDNNNSIDSDSKSKEKSNNNKKNNLNIDIDSSSEKNKKSQNDNNSSSHKT